jgi:hypothetical protein
MTLKRRRIKHASTFAERLAAEGKRLRTGQENAPRRATRGATAQSWPGGFEHERIAFVLRPATSEAVRPTSTMNR